MFDAFSTSCALIDILREHCQQNTPWKQVLQQQIPVALHSALNRTLLVAPGLTTSSKDATSDNAPWNPNLNGTVTQSAHRAVKHCAYEVKAVAVGAHSNIIPNNPSITIYLG